MAETEVDAVGVRVAADATVDEEGAVDGRAAADATVVDAVDRAEGDTRFLCRGVLRQPHYIIHTRVLAPTQYLFAAQKAESRRTMIRTCGHCCRICANSVTHPLAASRFDGRQRALGWVPRHSRRPERVWISLSEKGSSTLLRDLS